MLFVGACRVRVADVRPHGRRRGVFRESHKNQPALARVVRETRLRQKHARQGMTAPKRLVVQRLWRSSLCPTGHRGSRTSKARRRCVRPSSGGLCGCQARRRPPSLRLERIRTDSGGAAGSTGPDQPERVPLLGACAKQHQAVGRGAAGAQCAAAMRAAECASGTGELQCVPTAAQAATVNAAAAQ